MEVVEDINKCTQMTGRELCLRFAWPVSGINQYGECIQTWGKEGVGGGGSQVYSER